MSKPEDGVRGFNRIERIGVIALAVGAFISAGFAYDSAQDFEARMDEPAALVDEASAEQTVGTEISPAQQAFAEQALYGYTGLLALVGLAATAGAAFVPSRKTS